MLDTGASAVGGCRIGVLTVSDKASRGEREDRSGPAVRELVEPLGQVVCTAVVPDDPAAIQEILVAWSEEEGLDLILTTGGTGLGPRDLTPEATRPLLEREVPGIPEAMRAATRELTPFSILTRGVCGVRRRTLILNLPGSPKAVRECLPVVLPALGHAVALLTGEAGEHRI